MFCNEGNAGAVAFSRQGNPDLGEFENTVILKTFSEIPEPKAAVGVDLEALLRAV